MSVELLYTSAPKGLRQGSRGFCTVLSTAGTPINLATRLEALSGYRHLYATDSPDANLNPVAYSHLKFTLAGQPTSVISRVTAYGADYSGRTNKLAHHVVIDRSEAPAAGPAWLLQQPGLMRTSWDGTCNTPATGPLVPQGDQSGRICTTWHELTGDAGWGGAVADAFAKRSGKPTWIVYSIDQQDQLLKLLNESIALLPIDQRWNATFNTYASQLSPDIDCRVRCVVEGTEEARFAAARGQVIQLMAMPFEGPASERVNLGRGNFASTRRESPTLESHKSTTSAKKLAPRTYTAEPKASISRLPPSINSMAPPTPPDLPRNSHTHVVPAAIFAAVSLLVVFVALTYRGEKTGQIANSRSHGQGTHETQENITVEVVKAPKEKRDQERATGEAAEREIDESVSDEVSEFQTPQETAADNSPDREKLAREKKRRESAERERTETESREREKSERVKAKRHATRDIQAQVSLRSLLENIAIVGDLDDLQIGANSEARWNNLDAPPTIPNDDGFYEHNAADYQIKIKLTSNDRASVQTRFKPSSRHPLKEFQDELKNDWRKVESRLTAVIRGVPKPSEAAFHPSWTKIRSDLVSVKKVWNEVGLPPRLRTKRVTKALKDIGKGMSDTKQQLYEQKPRPTSIIVALDTVMENLDEIVLGESGNRSIKGVQEIDEQLLEGIKAYDVDTGCTLYLFGTSVSGEPSLTIPVRFKVKVINETP